MTSTSSAFIIAGVSSDVGKTSISLGLTRAAARAGSARGASGGSSAQADITFWMATVSAP